jgi:hypothetical protein
MIDFLTKPPASRRLIASLAVLLGILTLLLILLPPEQTLGVIIKVVFLHGALVQTGLLLFALGGLLGLALLAWDRPVLLAWALAVQETAVLLWIAYALSSMVTTKLAWGQWIAWDEPRVRASINVLWFCIAAWLLVRWVNNRTFTGLANLAVAIMAWVLIRGASLVRHPFNPIGDSTSSAYGWFFIAIGVTVLLIAVQVARWRAGKRLRIGE